MKQVITTTYHTDCGIILDTEKECLEYELVAKEIAKVMEQLVELPEDRMAFTNGSGYIQHPAFNRDVVMNQILDVACIYSTGLRMATRDYGINSYCISQLMYAVSNHHVVNAWKRLECTDDKLREYGQPYLKENPVETIVQLNEFNPSADVRSSRK